MKKKIATVICVLIILILGIFALWYAKNRRGGVKVTSTVEYNVNTNLVLYRQDDEKWKDDKLGASKYTVGSSGCVMTCIAMALSDTNIGVDPKDFNSFLSENNVFDADGNLQWGMLENIDGYHTAVYSEVSSDIIDACLKEGKYPIVKVHQNNIFSYHHYILIVGSEDGEYICMDPLQSEITKLSDYNNIVYAIRCVWYE